MLRARVYVAFLFVVACAGNVYDSARKDTIAASKTLSSAAEILGRYDHDHQIEIARGGVASGDLNRARLLLEDWEKTFKIIYADYVDAQAVIAKAAALIDKAEAAQSKVDLIGILSDVAAAVEKLREILRRSGVMQ